MSKPWPDKRTMRGYPDVAAYARSNFRGDGGPGLILGPPRRSLGYADPSVEVLEFSTTINLNVSVAAKGIVRIRASVDTEFSVEATVDGTIIKTANVDSSFAVDGYVDPFVLAEHPTITKAMTFNGSNQYGVATIPAEWWDSGELCIVAEFAQSDPPEGGHHGSLRGDDGAEVFWQGSPNEGRIPRTGYYADAGASLFIVGTYPTTVGMDEHRYLLWSASLKRDDPEPGDAAIRQTTQTVGGNSSTFANGPYSASRDWSSGMTQLTIQARDAAGTYPNKGKLCRLAIFPHDVSKADLSVLIGDGTPTVDWAKALDQWPFLYAIMEEGGESGSDWVITDRMKDQVAITLKNASTSDLTDDIPTGVIAVNASVNVEFGVEADVSAGVQVVETFDTPTTSTWTSPATVTSIALVEVWSSGGAGGDPMMQSGWIGGGGGGGGYAAEANYAVTASTAYDYQVGAGFSNGPGQESYFDSSTSVRASGGEEGFADEFGGLGGSGGQGTHGTTLYVGDMGTPGGIGGGEGGDGGAAAGPGGNGAGAAGGFSEQPGEAPGGGGGGGGDPDMWSGTPGAGAHGRVRLTYIK